MKLKKIEPAPSWESSHLYKIRSRPVATAVTNWGKRKTSLASSPPSERKRRGERPRIIKNKTKRYSLVAKDGESWVRMKGSGAWNSVLPTRF